MTTAENIKSLASRIKWRSVVAVVLLVAIIVLLWRSMPGSFQVAGSVGIRVTSDPSTVAPGGSSTFEVELKNVNAKGDISVVVNGKTYDKSLIFDESNAQTYGSAAITVGPQETRKVKLKVKTKPETLEGQYTFDFTAVPSGEDKGAETRVSLKVEKGA